MQQFIDPAIEILNERGLLTAPLLMRHLKLSWVDAVELMERIVEACENVRYRNEGFIYILGREPDYWIKKPKKKYVRPKKLKRWKNVREP